MRGLFLLREKGKGVLNSVGNYVVSQWEKKGKILIFEGKWSECAFAI